MGKLDWDEYIGVLEEWGSSSSDFDCKAIDMDGETPIEQISNYFQQIVEKHKKGEKPGIKIHPLRTGVTEEISLIVCENGYYVLENPITIRKYQTLGVDYKWCIECEDLDIGAYDKDYNEAMMEFANLFDYIVVRYAYHLIMDKIPLETKYKRDKLRFHLGLPSIDSLLGVGRKW